MAYNLDVNQSLKIIEFVQYGDLTSEDLENGHADVIALANSENLHRRLVDMSRITISASLLNIHDIPDVRFEEDKLNPDTKIALICATTQREIEMTEYFAAVSRNRGWAVATFGNRTEALEWLLAN